MIVNERDVRTFTEVFAWQEEGRINTLSVTSSMENRCDLILGRFNRLGEESGSGRKRFRNGQKLLTKTCSDEKIHIYGSTNCSFAQLKKEEYP